MIRKSLLQIAVVAMASSACYPQTALPASSDRTPVLVELFTSEGCSSCPPADSYVEFLDSQPIPGLELVVLSEHVDYWDHLGWRDPYSSREISVRQDEYRAKLRFPEVYTPQLVIDGTREMTGSDRQEAEDALRQAAGQAKIGLQLKVSPADRDRLSVRLNSLATNLGPRSLDVFVAFALNRAESQVVRGENKNRRLTHTAVLRKLVKVGKIRDGEAFSLATKMNPGIPLKNGLRVVAFLQDPDSRKVYGAAMALVATQ
jgi:hypothetical protein